MGPPGSRGTGLVLVVRRRGRPGWGRFLLLGSLGLHRRVADGRQQVGDVPGRLLGCLGRGVRDGGAAGQAGKKPSRRGPPRGAGLPGRAGLARRQGLAGHAGLAGGAGLAGRAGLAQCPGQRERRAGVRSRRGRPGRRHVERTGLGAQPAGRRAVRGLPGQRRGDQRHERRGDAGQVGPTRDDAVEDRLIGAAAERQVPGRRERHRRTPGVHVRRWAARLALDHLGGEIPRRAHHQTRLGQPGGITGLGDAEVDHDGAVVGEHHVARLQVAVHYARRVDRRQGLGHAVGQPAQALAGQRAAGAHHLVQRGPGHEARDNVRVFAGHVGVQDLGDVRAADPAHRLHLPGQPPTGVLPLGAVRMEHLDRHRAPFRVAGEVHYPHAAFPKAVLKAVRAESPRQIVRRRHRGFQSTKQIACCGANEMLPIGNGLDACGRGPTTLGGPTRPEQPRGGQAAASAVRTTITSISTCWG